MQDNGTKLAQAYADLRQRNEKVTVRSLREAAGVQNAIAAAWLREHAVTKDVAATLDMPDLSEAWKLVWTRATTSAVEQLRESTDSELNTAREGEARAIEAQQDAENERERAIREAETARGRALSMDKELNQLRAELAQARADGEAARTRADRAEATVDTLREVLADLKPAQKPEQDEK